MTAASTTKTTPRRRSPYACNVGDGKPRGWEYYLVEIEGGDLGSEVIAASGIEAARAWAKIWTEGGDWSGSNTASDVMVRICPVARNSQGHTYTAKWGGWEWNRDRCVIFDVLVGEDHEPDCGCYMCSDK